MLFVFLSSACKPDMILVSMYLFKLNKLCLSLSPFMIRWRERSSFDMIIFNRWPRSPWVILFASRTRRRTFEMSTLWHSNISRHLHLGTPNIRYFQQSQVHYWLAWLPIWFERVICVQRQLRANYDSYKCDTLLLKYLGKSALKEADWDCHWALFKLTKIFTGCEANRLRWHCYSIQKTRFTNAGAPSGLSLTTTVQGVMCFWA